MKPSEAKGADVKLVELIREARPVEREGSFELVLRGGSRVYVRGAADEATLRAIVRALEA